MGCHLWCQAEEEVILESLAAEELPAQLGPAEAENHHSWSRLRIDDRSALCLIRGAGWGQCVFISPTKEYI